MVDEPPLDTASPSSGPTWEQKKREKARSAWFTFASRVVAQVVGAAATVALTLFVIQKYQATPQSEPATEPDRRAASARPVAAWSAEVTLAVLPLQNFSGDPSQDYFADGMTEAIIADLARIGELTVISRTSSMRYKGSQQSLPDIAGELGATHMLEGSIARVDDRVRVTVQLIDAASDRHVWAKVYHATAKDVLLLQAQLATAIAREIGVAVTPDVERRLASRGTVNPDAYALYLEGRTALALRTQEGFAEAIRLFKQSAATDSSFARAYSGLSDAYNLLSRSPYAEPSPKNTMEQVRDAAERAIALDPLLADAHSALGSVHHRFDWNWAAAEQEFRRAIEIRPGYAQGHQWLSILLAEQGRFEEARAESTRATVLDPRAPATQRTAGLVEYLARRYDRAEALQRTALALDPKATVTRLTLAAALVEGGKAVEARTICEETPAGSPQDAELQATLGYSVVKAGDTARARQILQQLLSKQPAPSLALARLMAGLGDHAQVLHLVERAVNEKLDMVTALKVDPAFDGLRSNPRFTSILTRLKL